MCSQAVAAVERGPAAQVPPSSCYRLFGGFAVPTLMKHIFMLQADNAAAQQFVNKHNQYEEHTMQAHGEVFDAVLQACQGQACWV